MLTFRGTDIQKSDHDGSGVLPYRSHLFQFTSFTYRKTSGITPNYSGIMPYEISISQKRNLMFLRSILTLRNSIYTFLFTTLMIWRSTFTIQENTPINSLPSNKMPRRNYPLQDNIPTKRKTHTKNFHQNSIKRNCIASSQKKSRTSFYCRSIFLHCNAFVLSQYNPLISKKSSFNTV